MRHYPPLKGGAVRALAPWYGAGVLLLVVVLALEYLALPLDRRVALASAFVGADYVRVQFPTFDRHRLLMMAHVGAGLTLALLCPLQLWASFRNRWLTLHRGFGVVFVAAAVITVLTGILIAARLPFSGSWELLPNVIWGGLFLFCVTRAVTAVVAGDTWRHREWMVRGLGLALGIGLARVYLAACVHFLGFSTADGLLIALWLGSGTNFAVAELWVRARRRTVESPASSGVGAYS